MRLMIFGARPWDLPQGMCRLQIADFIPPHSRHFTAPLPREHKEFEQGPEKTLFLVENLPDQGQLFFGENPFSRAQLYPFNTVRWRGCNDIPIKTPIEELPQVRKGQGACAL